MHLDVDCDKPHELLLRHWNYQCALIPSYADLFYHIPNLRLLFIDKERSKAAITNFQGKIWRAVLKHGPLQKAGIWEHKFVPISQALVCLCHSDLQPIDCTLSRCSRSPQYTTACLLCVSFANDWWIEQLHLDLQRASCVDFNLALVHLHQLCGKPCDSVRPCLVFPVSDGLQLCSQRFDHVLCGWQKVVHGHPQMVCEA